MNSAGKLQWIPWGVALLVWIGILLIGAVSVWRTRTQVPLTVTSSPTVDAKAPSSSQEAPLSSDANLLSLLAAVGYVPGGGDSEADLLKVRAKTEAITVRYPDNPYGFAMLALVCEEMKDCTFQKRAADRSKELASRIAGTGLNIRVLDEMARACQPRTTPFDRL